MLKVCSASQMRKADSIAINEYGIPGIVLMENAAGACVKRIGELFDINGAKVCVFCGKGNNGGDGFAIARRLIDKGALVTCYLVCGDDFGGDALVNYEVLEKLPCEIVDASNDTLDDIDRFDLVVDAILGTGISGTVRDDAYSVIQKINDKARFVFSVDVPSGLNADTGEICGICVRANETVTLAAYKKGMLTYPGADYCGNVTVGDISMPAQILSQLNINITDDAFAKIPARSANSHKGTYGKLFIVAGSIGMTGAAALASEAALRTGAGLVTLGIPTSLNGIMEQKLTEVMTCPLSDISGHLEVSASRVICDKAARCDALLFGPGVGRSADVGEVLEAVLSDVSVPVVIDADGLYALAKNPNMLANCASPVVLTPHSQELARLLNTTVERVEADRFGACAAAAERFGATVILKGHYTITTTPDGTQYVNTTGNAGMAKGGSGDVLAGIVSALIAKGFAEGDSAAAGAYIHGKAGDVAAAKYGIESMTATNIIDCLSSVL